jgi:hypothetical protein
MDKMKFPLHYLLDNPCEKMGLVDPSITRDINSSLVLEFWTERWGVLFAVSPRQLSLTTVEQVP